MTYVVVRDLMMIYDDYWWLLISSLTFFCKDEPIQYNQYDMIHMLWYPTHVMNKYLHGPEETELPDHLLIIFTKDRGMDQSTTCILQGADFVDTDNFGWDLFFSLKGKCYNIPLKFNVCFF